jgi:RNA polymerase sigma-70 factor (ECF subfamily)
VSIALAQRLDTALTAPRRQKAVDPDLAFVERFNYLAMRYLKNDADSADIAQKTFVRAYKKMDTFKAKSAFRTWLYRIAINLSLNHIRDNKRERATDISDDALSQSAVGMKRMVEDERSAALREAIEELPEKQRMVLELRIYDELPFKEVAQLASCTENAAKVNFHHAVKRLKKLMAARQEMAV